MKETGSGKNSTVRSSGVSLSPASVQKAPRDNCAKINDKHDRCSTTPASDDDSNAKIAVVGILEEENEQDILPPITPQASANVLVSPPSLVPGGCSTSIEAEHQNGMPEAQLAANRVVTPSVRSKKSKKRAKILCTLPLAVVSSPPATEVVEAKPESKVSQNLKADLDGDHAVSDISITGTENIKKKKQSMHADEICKFRDMAKDLIVRANAIDLCLNDDNSEVAGSPIEVGHTFPEVLRQKLAVIVYESHLPLSQLSHRCHEILKANAPELTLDQTAECIQLIAERKPMFGTINDNKVILELPDCSGLEKVEDATKSSVWRWKLISTDLLPAGSICSKKKSARTKLGKLANVFKCCRRLVVNLLKCEDDPQNIEKLKDRIYKDRQIILKYELEEKKKREQQTKCEFEQAEKTKAVEKKKAQRIAEKLAKKEEARRLKEQERRAKEEERRAELLAKELTAKKKKERFASFFPTKKIKPSSCSVGKSISVAASFGLESDFNSYNFWSKIDASLGHVDPKKILGRTTLRARKSRKKTIKNISLTVTINPNTRNNPFQNTSVYSEQKTVDIRGRYRYLKFHEDYRPPYHGTWSKKSKILNGRNPFAKDTTFLDYDYDSEAEWEEEEEDGESCNDEDADSIDEKFHGKDTKALDYDDGWLMEDDDLGLSDDDAEAKGLRRGGGKIKSGENIDAPLMIIPPRVGGLAISSHSGKDQVVLADHVTHVLLPEFDLCMDQFGPKVVYPSCAPAKKKSNSKDMSKEEMATFCRFVHQSTLSSKDKVIDEFRSQYPNIFSKSRAAALRKLDSIAVKSRPAQGGGYVWEVKADVLASNGLSHLQTTNDTQDVKSSPPEMVQDTVSLASKNEVANTTIQVMKTPTKSVSSMTVAPATSVSPESTAPSAMKKVLREDGRDEIGKKRNTRTLDSLWARSSKKQKTCQKD
uniref:Chromatin assembly factor 1 subunit A dimerization domain-containing protein n=1 Tax=Leptocylindrus danicus TaxID=163516 RepID=A0A7S2KPT4_9STRA